MLNNDYCPICLDTFNKPTISKCCNNVFCFKCIVTALNNQGTCPFCRSKITLNELTVMENNLKNIKKKEEESNELKSKNDNLIKTIQNNPDCKFLIFSNNLESFYYTK